MNTEQKQMTAFNQHSTDDFMTVSESDGKLVNKLVLRGGKQGRSAVCRRSDKLQTAFGQKPSSFGSDVPP